MAIRNAGVSAESIGLGLTSGTAKSFGFCFYAGQDKIKTKRFWLIARRNGNRVQPRTAHSRDRYPPFRTIQVNETNK